MLNTNLPIRPHQQAQQTFTAGVDVSTKQETIFADASGLLNRCAEAANRLRGICSRVTGGNPSVPGEACNRPVDSVAAFIQESNFQLSEIEQLIVHLENRLG